ncbi:hypothetical protein KAJ38_03355 [Candidatus Pacearchaeota archaeon]|nr:hypothetical protein [Candidatus Pacearchaeota archaeon]
MRCTVCKRTSDEVRLLEGILKAEMVRVCTECAKTEGIPLVHKPSEEQLEKANERYSVRERMERLSGMRDTTEISNDQIVTQGNLAKLRVPPKKQHNDEVLDNYYWTLNIARRRKKLSIGQLARLIKIETNVLQSIEKGKIPENFKELFLKLESFLGIKLLKNHKPQIHFTRTKDEEQQIFKSVREKMGQSQSDKIPSEEKQEVIEKIAKGEIDFSKRESLQDVNLNDLVEMKKAREKKNVKRKVQIQTDAMIGDDIDLDIDEL